MPERSRSTEVEYHRRRARSERDVAYRSANELAADAHMRLSALHLQRALLLQAMDRGPVGNIHPIRTGEHRTQAYAPADYGPVEPRPCRSR
jgi:hypothetical protein